MQPDDSVIRLELERILASSTFIRSKRLSKFLRFTVERALERRLDDIKEYQVGTEVYQRGADFDPKVDNIVRVEANRLRAKLRDYYENDGQADSVRFEIPKGAYAPVFTAIRREPRRDARWIFRVAPVVLALFVLTGISMYSYLRGHSWQTVCTAVDCRDRAQGDYPGVGRLALVFDGPIGNAYDGSCRGRCAAYDSG